MAHLVPIPFLIMSVFLLVRAALRGKREQMYIFKPLSTALVIVVALLSLLLPGSQTAFTLSIAFGLVLSLGGDVALIFESKRAFLFGLVFFLLAHIVYSITFTIPNGFHPADSVTGVILLVVAAAIVLYLWPGLGKMQVPVILYTLVICFMVNRAVSAFFGDGFTRTQAWLLSLGAIFFMLSDVVLAVNRFRRPMKRHRLSLFAYYLGQLLIALSPAYFD